MIPRMDPAELRRALKAAALGTVLGAVLVVLARSRRAGG
jgi:hypothetical protein